MSALHLTMTEPARYARSTQRAIRYRGSDASARSRSALPLLQPGHRDVHRLRWSAASLLIVLSSRNGKTRHSSGTALSRAMVPLSYFPSGYRTKIIDLRFVATDTLVAGAVRPYQDLIWLPKTLHKSSGLSRPAATWPHTSPRVAIDQDFGGFRES